VRFIFFTKTDWVEPPRLRHQLARLLADAGHQVIFFERPIYPWENFAHYESGHPNIILYRFHQCLHHKLRIHRALHYLNAIFEKKEISRFIFSLKINKSDVIVNFNYDYFFLRDVFPGNKLITIINDDFWTRAILGYERPLKWALTATCRASNVVLTVSPPLANQLKEFCDPQIFFPWADIVYKSPENSCNRDIFLFWGYINSKIDFEYVRQFAELIKRQNQGLKLLFVGPIQAGINPLTSLKNYCGIEFHGITPLDDLPLERVLAGFIPYKSGLAENDAIVLPNKALQLMARGLPLVITGMPEFVRLPFVFRLDKCIKSDLDTLREIHSRFYALQPSIKSFVDENSSEHRLTTFLELVL
jgi:hypothetical protein